MTAAEEDLQNERWARDFADKLQERNITVAIIRQVIEHADVIVLYRDYGLRAVGFWSFQLRLVVIWSPLHPSRWVSAFWKAKGRRYLLSRDDAELLWERR